MSKKQNLTFEKNNQTEKHLQPYCAQAAIAAVEKQKADELREQASKELQDKLESDPETRDFTGTVVYICEGEMYKIRVQRPDKTDWLSKRLSDPQFKEYKAGEEGVSPERTGDRPCSRPSQVRRKRVRHRFAQ